jgi:sodium transport system ATP-binding protein
MIVVHDLQKSFGPVQALRGLSFRAEDGQITGLVGHNGAGKTTTFRILAGLLKPTEGTALVDEWDVAAARVEAQKRIGVLPDVRGLYPRLTAREHIQYFGRLYGLDEDEIAAREDILISHLGMESFVDRPTKGFSRGQRLKVALAQCLVHNPHNIIFDEPTSGLDIASIKAMHDLILELKSLGSCVLISSHIISEIAKLCDKIVIIAEGRDIMAGTPQDLADKGGRGDLETLFLQVAARSPLKAVERAR